MKYVGGEAKGGGWRGREVSEETDEGGRGGRETKSGEGGEGAEREGCWATFA